MSIQEKKIFRGMSDVERANIIKEKHLKNLPFVRKLSSEEISSWEEIDVLSGNAKQTLIHNLAKEFGVFKEYSYEDISLTFEFTHNGYRETHGKQKKNFKAFAKMFSVFDKVIENAVGIEVHNRNEEGYKPDVTLENVYVLLSAYEDENSITPIKLAVKEFKGKSNKLYVAIALETIKKTEVSKQGNTNNGVTQNSRSVNISILDLISKINPKDTDFLKYIPNELLNEEQIKSKEIAEAVTYDDNGEVIPLSERFKDDNEDIRFSYKNSSNKSLTSKGEKRYNKNSVYDEFTSNGMQWAYNEGTKIGDTKYLFNPNTDKHCIIEATKGGKGFIIIEELPPNKWREKYGRDNEVEKEGRSLYWNINQYESAQKRESDNSNSSRHGGEDGRNVQFSQEDRFQSNESGNLERDGKNNKGTQNKINHSLDWVEFAEKQAKERSAVSKVTELEKINEELRAQIRHPMKIGCFSLNIFTFYYCSFIIIVL